MNNRNTTTRYRVPTAVLAAAAVVAAFTTTANAQNAYWTGVNSGNWSNVDGDNWSTTAASPGTPTSPANGNTLNFRGTFGINKTTNNDIVGLSVAGISMNIGTPTGYELNGNKLTLTGAILGAGTGSNTINLPLELDVGTSNFTGNTLGSGLLTINGDITETGGSRGVNYLGGALALNGANSFTGNSVVGVQNDVELTINTLANTTSAQSLGQGALIQLGHTSGNGTIIYNGSANAATDKGFQIGRSTAASTGTGSFINNGIGVVTWNGAQTKASAKTVGLTFTLGGSNTGNNTWQSAIEDNSASGTIGITKEGAGKWILGGANTYTGATSVEEGVLLVNGSLAAGSAVTVDLDAVFGGNGTVNGNLTLASGALFAFDTGSTLDLAGTLTIDPSFGVASLRNTSGGSINWATIDQGTYTLMNTTFAFNDTNISNFGVNKAADLAGDKSAYFQQGSSPSSLQLVVVPEPTTLGLTALGMGLAGVACWRRRRG